MTENAILQNSFQSFCQAFCYIFLDGIGYFPVLLSHMSVWPFAEILYGLLRF